MFFLFVLCKIKKNVNYSKFSSELFFLGYYFCLLLPFTETNYIVYKIFCYTLQPTFYLFLKYQQRLQIILFRPNISSKMTSFKINDFTKSLIKKNFKIIFRVLCNFYVFTI